MTQPCFWTDYLGCTEDCGGGSAVGFWIETSVPFDSLANLGKTELDLTLYPNSDPDLNPDVKAGDVLKVRGGKFWYLTDPTSECNTNAGCDIDVPDVYPWGG